MIGIKDIQVETSPVEQVIENQPIDTRVKLKITLVRKIPVVPIPPFLFRIELIVLQPVSVLLPAHGGATLGWMQEECYDYEVVYANKAKGLTKGKITIWLASSIFNEPITNWPLRLIPLDMKEFEIK